MARLNVIQFCKYRTKMAMAMSGMFAKKKAKEKQKRMMKKEGLDDAKPTARKQRKRKVNYVPETRGNA